MGPVTPPKRKELSLAKQATGNGAGPIRDAFRIQDLSRKCRSGDVSVPLSISTRFIISIISWTEALDLECRVAYFQMAVGLDDHGPFEL